MVLNTFLREPTPTGPPFKPPTPLRSAEADKPTIGWKQLLSPGTLHGEIGPNFTATLARYYLLCCSSVVGRKRWTYMQRNETRAREARWMPVSVCEGIQGRIPLFLSQDQMDTVRIALFVTFGLFSCTIRYVGPSTVQQYIQLNVKQLQNTFLTSLPSLPTLPLVVRTSIGRIVMVRTLWFSPKLVMIQNTQDCGGCTESGLLVAG